METAVISMRCNGQSAVYIADKLGGGVTRNAVLGKIYRLRKAGHLIPLHRPEPPPRVRSTPPAPPRVRSTPPAPPRVQRARPAPLRVQRARPAPLPLANSAITMMDLKANHCRWPLNDAVDEEFIFCGDNRVSGKPYCVEHCAAAYVKPKGAR